MLGWIEIYYSYPDTKHHEIRQRISIHQQEFTELSLPGIRARKGASDQYFAYYGDIQTNGQS
jgi:hypothetical protein